MYYRIVIRNKPYPCDELVECAGLLEAIRRACALLWEKPWRSSFTIWEDGKAAIRGTKKGGAVLFDAP